MRRAQMRHFQWLSLTLGMVGLFLAACSAEVPGDGTGTDDPAAALRAQFNSDVLPLMQQRCAACHGGSMEFIDFMAPNEDFATEYDRVKGWPALINTEDASQSRLITKGQHDGPAWGPEDLNLINPWLQAEADLGKGGDEIDTTAITPISGDNEYDLGDLGVTEAAGCLIRFQYDFSPPIIYITNLRIQGDADGCLLDNPVVAAVTDPDGDGTDTTWYDPNNKFSGLTVDVGPDQEVLVGGGSVIISWVPAEELQGTVRIKFRFFNAEATGTGSGGDGGGGAKLVDVFYNTIINGNCNLINGTANGTPCTNCHAGGGGAVGSLDLNGMNSQDPDVRQQLANQFFIRSNRTDPTGTHDWIAKIDPNAGVGHAGGKNGTLAAACDPPNDDWISMEINQ